MVYGIQGSGQALNLKEEKNLETSWSNNQFFIFSSKQKCELDHT